MTTQPGHRLLIRNIAETPDRGLYADEREALALFNAECSRGVAHTPEWTALMAGLQARWDAASAADL